MRIGAAVPATGCQANLRQISCLELNTSRAIASSSRLIPLAHNPTSTIVLQIMIKARDTSLANRRTSALRASESSVTVVLTSMGGCCAMATYPAYLPCTTICETSANELNNACTSCSNDE